MYSIRRSQMRLKKGMLILSTDIDVGSPLLGIINKGKRDKDVNTYLSEHYVGKLEELAIPCFVDTLESFGVPMSIAFRGQLAEVGGKVFDLLLSLQSHHDIGAHGYYHRMFTQLTHNEAEEDLTKTSEEMEKIGLHPKTFIFPRNRVAHLDLLAKHGYVCFRSRGGNLRDRMYIEHCGELIDIHPSIYINEHSRPFLLNKMLDIAVRERLPFHAWFHFWNFGEDKNSVSKTIEELFVPFLQHAKEKQENGLLTFQTMFSAASYARSFRP